VTPLISAVVVTYNSAACVGRCLESVSAHTASPFETIVVDNASSDGTVTLVERDHPEAKVVRRRRNGGLSAAINDGVGASAGEYVVVLNPDVRFDEDVLSSLAAYLPEHPDAGIVAPKLLDEDGTVQMSCRSFPGYSTALFNRYSLLTRLFPGNRRSRDYLMADFDHASVRDVDWVSGAALMIPRRVFDEVGGWDPGFFMFNEDVDLCRRVHDRGYRVVYNPTVAVYHAIGVSKSRAPRMILARHRSMWRYYRKHLRGGIVRDAVTAAGIAARCGWMLAASGIGAIGARAHGRSTVPGR
jgi:GT2 family glycosyltransferase